MNTPPAGATNEALSALLRDALALTELHNDADQREFLAAEAEHHARQELVVVIAGENSRGKSSLVESILDEYGLLPVAAPAVTNAPTVLRHGPAERIVVRLRVGEQEECREITRAQIREYVSEQGNEANAKQVVALEVQLPHPKLVGLVLLDTPGLGTENPLHAAATFAVAPDADAVLFVSSAGRELTTEEVAWAKKLVRRPETFVYVLTHRDQVPEWGAVMRADVAKLAAALGLPADRVPAAAVSNPLKRRAANSKSADELRRSGFPELEAQLSRLLAGARGLLARRAAGAAAGACRALREPLDAAAAALAAASRAEMERLRAQFMARRAELELFDEKRPEWQQLVSHQSTRMQNACTRWQREEFQALRDRIEGDYLGRPNELGRLLGEDIGRLNADMGDLIRSEMKKVRTRITSETGLDVRLDYAHPGQELTTAAPDAPGLGAMDTVATYGRNVLGMSFGFAGAGMVAGGLIGGALGTVVAPVAGTIGGAALGAALGAKVAGLFGSAVGFVRGFRSVAQARREEVKKVLYPKLSALQTEVELGLREASSECVNALAAAVLQAIQVRRRALTEAIRRIEDALKASQEEAAARLAELRRQIAAVDAVLGRAAPFLGGAAAAGPAPAAGGV